MRSGFQIVNLLRRRESEDEAVGVLACMPIYKMGPPDTRLLLPVTICAPFAFKHRPASSRFISGDHPMPALRASTILGAVEAARSELVGKAVVLTDGKAGTVDDVWLDELHGLRISIIGHVGKWPISTIKFAQG
jgi:hypothetical protein